MPVYLQMLPAHQWNMVAAIHGLFLQEQIILSSQFKNNTVK